MGVLRWLKFLIKLLNIECWFRMTSFWLLWMFCFLWRLIHYSFIQPVQRKQRFLDHTLISDRLVKLSEWIILNLFDNFFWTDKLVISLYTCQQARLHVVLVCTFVDKTKLSYQIWLVAIFAGLPACCSCVYFSALSACWNYPCQHRG